MRRSFKDYQAAGLAGAQITRAGDLHSHRTLWVASEDVDAADTVSVSVLGGKMFGAASLVSAERPGKLGPESHRYAGTTLPDSQWNAFLSALDSAGIVYGAVYSPGGRRLEVLEQREVEHPDTGKMVTITVNVARAKLHEEIGKVGLAPMTSAAAVARMPVEEITALLAEQTEKEVPEWVKAATPEHEDAPMIAAAADAKVAELEGGK